MAAGKDVNDEVTVCGEMASAANKFGAGSRFVERREAYVFDAAALLRAKLYPEAEGVARRAVAVVEEGHDDAAGVSAAYAVLGNAEALNGNLADADKNLTTAEDMQRKAITQATDDRTKVQRAATLRTILEFHADALERMGRNAEAGTRRVEAARLAPSLAGS